MLNDIDPTSKWVETQIVEFDLDFDTDAMELGALIPM